jgi:hypothetical protein
MNCKTLILFSQLSVMPSAVLMAQCNNTVQFPTGTLAITTSINTISTSQWAGDYNVTTGYINAATCTFPLPWCVSHAPLAIIVFYKNNNTMKTLFSIILACTLQHTYSQVQKIDSVYNVLIQA